MRNVRTDLALEAKELWQESAKEQTEIKGVSAQEFEKNGCFVHRVHVLDDAGASALGKPIGEYVTIELRSLYHREADEFLQITETLREELKRMLPQQKGCVLVVGLGNHNITPDAVGSKTVQHIMVTRHLVEKVPDLFGAFQPVAAVVPGVLGTTGVESREMIRSIVRQIRPGCVIVIDALASRKLSRLCKTIQITDTGIIPGSGVGNARAAITEETLGVPVIAIGVPTVVDIKTIAYDLAEQAQVALPLGVFETEGEPMMVTPQEIDAHIADVAKIMGYAINGALQDISIEEIDAFLS